MTAPSAPSESAFAASHYKIVVAMSLDATADAALSQALSLAARTPGSQLHAVHVVDESAALATGATAADEGSLTQAKGLLAQRLESACRESGEVDVIMHMRSGNAASMIIQTAIDVDADVVIVGSHRRTGLRKLVLGSVAERVLHGSHCPVLVAFPKDHRESAASPPRLEPLCADCLAARKSSAHSRLWCERHSKPYLAPHVYVPRDEARPSGRIF